MSPDAPVYDSPDESLIDGKSACELGLRHTPSSIEGSDLQDLGFSKFGTRMLASTGVCPCEKLAPCLSSIPIIVGRGACIYVRGIAANPVIAAVTRHVPLWYRTMNQLISDMRSRMGFFVNAELPVPLRSQSGFPRPTLIWPAFVHPRPEPFRYGAIVCVHDTTLAAEPIRLSPGRKYAAAKLAMLFDWHSTPPKGKAPLPARFLSREPEGHRGHENTNSARLCMFPRQAHDTPQRLECQT
jgi:hypothetical protein